MCVGQAMIKQTIPFTYGVGLRFELLLEFSMVYESDSEPSGCTWLNT